MNNKFKISKNIMMITSSLYLLLFLLGLFGNPLSEKNISPGITKPIDLIELEDENFWEENYEGDFESINYYYYSDNKERISFLKRQDSNCNQFEIKFINGSIECVSLDDIQNPNIHPLEYLSNTTNNYHLLGTIAINKGDSGIDRLSNLSDAVFRTTLFSLLSLSTFLIFGIAFALSIGYYNGRLTSHISELIVKSFQCVPILLWMLITIIVIGYSRNLDPLWKVSLYFLFFGLFSSPALSNLIIEKINQMKNEDFIVALKLLGLSDYRIIVSHMLRYYCLPIIICQMAYVMAHAFFLDLTLCYIEKSNESSSTLGWYIYQSYTRGNYATDTTFLLFISFFLTFTLFYWSDYYKRKI